MLFMREFRSFILSVCFRFFFSFFLSALGIVARKFLQVRAGKRNKNTAHTHFLLKVNLISYHSAHSTEKKKWNFYRYYCYGLRCVRKRMVARALTDEFVRIKFLYFNLFRSCAQIMKQQQHKLPVATASVWSWQQSSRVNQWTKYDAKNVDASLHLIYAHQNTNQMLRNAANTANEQQQQKQNRFSRFFFFVATVRRIAITN